MLRDKIRQTLRNESLSEFAMLQNELNEQMRVERNILKNEFNFIENYYHNQSSKESQERKEKVMENCQVGKRRREGKWGFILISSWCLVIGEMVL
jgi:hypothetical protein